jgi:hypothetical protein
VKQDNIISHVKPRWGRSGLQSVPDTRDIPQKLGPNPGKSSGSRLCVALIEPDVTLKVLTLSITIDKPRNR